MATFYNQATLSYNGNLASSNITAGEILENLFVTKTPVNSNYSADRDNSFENGFPKRTYTPGLKHGVGWW